MLFLWKRQISIGSYMPFERWIRADLTSFEIDAYFSTVSTCQNERTDNL